MRIFMVLASYLAVATAGHSVIVGSTDSAGASSFSAANAVYTSRSNGASNLIEVDYDAGYRAGLAAAAKSTAQAYAVDGNARATANTKVLYNPAVVQKHFYYHVAPEEPAVQAEANTLTITPRKHYKVIFIKAPTVSANAGARSSAASQTEEKTIVYVLVNKPAQAKAVAEADASSFSSGKPEVYFIKYQGKDAQAGAFSGAASGAADGARFSGGVRLGAGHSHSGAAASAGSNVVV